jgi:hypothetical protein
MQSRHKHLHGIHELCKHLLTFLDVQSQTKTSTVSEIGCSPGCIMARNWNASQQAIVSHIAEFQQLLRTWLNEQFHLVF